MKRPDIWCALFAAGLIGCSHAKPTVHPYVHGRPPKYVLPAHTKPAESVAGFIARVKGMEARAEAARQRSVIPTVETSDPALGRALALLTLDPSAANHRGVAAEYLRVGVRDFAHEHLTEAIRLAPTDGAAYDARARIARDWGFPGLALPDAHRAVFFAARSAAAHNTLGTVFYRLGRYLDARRQYDAAFSLDPQAAYALTNLCTLDLAEGKPGDAAVACGKALEIEPGLAVAQASLSRAAALMRVADTGSEHARD
jgi:tetratricopeptide (TPR) repeat protein